MQRKNFGIKKETFSSLNSERNNEKIDPIKKNVCFNEHYKRKATNHNPIETPFSEGKKFRGCLNAQKWVEVRK